MARDATAAEIKGAFRRSALKLHPDVNSAPDANLRFQEISGAYGAPPLRLFYGADVLPSMHSRWASRQWCMNFVRLTRLDSLIMRGLSHRQHLQTVFPRRVRENCLAGHLAPSLQHHAESDRECVNFVLSYWNCAWLPWTSRVDEFDFF